MHKPQPEKVRHRCNHILTYVLCRVDSNLFAGDFFCEQERVVLQSDHESGGRLRNFVVAEIGPPAMVFPVQQVTSGRDYTLDQLLHQGLAGLVAGSPL